MYKKMVTLMCLVLVMALTVANTALGVTWEGKITSSQDCPEQTSVGPAGTMDFGSSDLEFMDDGGIQVVGLRFTSVQVPAGATISKAYVVLWGEEIETDAVCNIIIQAHLTPNAPAFSSSPGDISNRPLTTAVAKWSPEHWAVDDQPHETSDLSAVIKEIVEQSGWVQGNAIAVIFNQDPDNPSLSHRTCHKVDVAGMEPLLHIEYTLGSATGPNPLDGQTDVSRDTDLSWRAGIYAAATNGHTVYFSESYEDVSSGIGGVTQSATVYDPGRLEYGTTYYWRVDENSELPSPEITEGSVWSFTTEFYSYPIAGENIIATASSIGTPTVGPGNTINGSGLDENDLHSTMPEDMWLSGIEAEGAWIQYEFDKEYKLHEMWVWNSNQVLESLFGFGLKEVTVEYSTNGTDWTAVADVPEFAQAPGTDQYAHNTTVDFSLAVAKYVKLTVTSNWGGMLPQYSLSEVRFYAIPTYPITPSPDDGAIDVDVVDATLSWQSGREAATHNVYLSTDEQAVIDGTAPVASAATVSYSPPALDLNTSYYWKVTEVNETEMPTIWEGRLWSFTTTDVIVVEDFESYNDLNPDQAGTNRIFEAWIDGFGTATNGALAGNEVPPYTEQTIVHSGKQSMPLFYSNVAPATYSEVGHTFVTPQNWTQHGVKTLTVWFQGTPVNTGQLYVKINNSKILYTGEAGNIARVGWQPWNIDLTASGLNLQNVASLAIGIDGNGASGTLYIDDIRLYPYERQFITPVAPNTAGLVGLWTFDGNTQDSSGKGNHGTSGVTPVAYVAGKVGSNAMNFRGADYVAIDGVVNDITSTDITLSAWIKTTQNTEGNLFAANDDTSGYDLLFGIQSGNPYVNDDGDKQFPPIVNDDQWHLLTYVRNGDTGYIYVDGILQGSYASSFTLETVTRWSIGQEWDDAGTIDPSDFYVGAVDDARIYNYALSDAEVASLSGRTEPFDLPF
ncbi:MAG: discoidin domain-containing protein [Sedimentisphaerales bacterium]|nr:discoidin domain-containing protein [Sedimentisphaerales bacterium]